MGKYKRTSKQRNINRSTETVYTKVFRLKFYVNNVGQVSYINTSCSRLAAWPPRTLNRPQRARVVAAFHFVTSLTCHKRRVAPRSCIGETSKANCCLVGMSRGANFQLVFF